MATLTIRLPDDKHRRLKALAEHRHVSVNKLMEELSTLALAEFDSEVKPSDKGVARYVELFGKSCGYV